MGEGEPKRVLGILIVGMLVLIAGIVLLVSGITTLLAPGGTTGDFWLRGVGYVILGALVTIAAFGLLRRRLRAWNLAFIVVLIALGYSLYQAFFGIGFTGLGGLAITLQIIALGYLIVVRRRFRRVVVMRA